MMPSREQPASPWWRRRWLRAVLVLVGLFAVVRFVLLPELSGSADTMSLIAEVPVPFLVAAIALEAAALV
ncbi:MAG: hypothetical protein ABIS86_10475, partial [Streptosporangiaceae bacterium]